MAKPERPKRRMLLVASLGVASVSYVAACEHHDPGAGNGPAPPQTFQPVSGNLMAPQPHPRPEWDADAPTSDASTSGVIDAGSNAVDDWVDVSPTAGNLMVQAPASASARPAKPKPPRPNPVGGNLTPPTQ